MKEVELLRDVQVSEEIGGARDRRRRWLGLSTRRLFLWSNEGGAVAIVIGIMATVVVAIVGLGLDVVVWYRTDRALQNAALTLGNPTMTSFNWKAE